MGNSTKRSYSRTTKGNSTREIDSVSQVHTITGSHNFEVQNYALTKGYGIGKVIKSRTFFVGGYEWVIGFCPHGNNNDYSDYMSVFLQFISREGEPRTSCSFSLHDYALGEAVYTKEYTHTFKSSSNNWGFPKFLERNTFETSKCLKQDSLTIICNVTVIKEQVTYSNVPFTAPAPPNIHERLGGLLLRKKGVDITVKVGGKSFPAHKCVLAASSPVFEAQLFGLMKESKKKTLEITDIEASVFEAVLHFIYNDALPEFDKDADTVMTQHLLVAADRYLLERLRFTCEQKLCNNLDTNNVGTTLALAEQHNLPHLKAECLRQLASPQFLRSAIETDGFEHLLKSCPSVGKDIICKMI